jgi:hypothetical protein
MVCLSTQTKASELIIIHRLFLVRIPSVFPIKSKERKFGGSE